MQLRCVFIRVLCTLETNGRQNSGNIATLDALIKATMHVLHRTPLAQSEEQNLLNTADLSFYEENQFTFTSGYQP